MQQFLHLKLADSASPFAVNHSKQVYIFINTQICYKNSIVITKRGIIGVFVICIY